MTEEKGKRETNRREFLASGARGAAAVSLGALTGVAGAKANLENLVWQIDPAKCVQCGRCATECVLSPSAVKCVHAFAMCGYCELCFGYFLPDAEELNSAAENQACPTGAIKRSFVEEPYYEYVVDEQLCIGCGKCVKGCNTFGNGALYLQVRHDRCLNCNDCRIAASCAGDAFVRVPAETPYIRKGEEAES